MNVRKKTETPATLTVEWDAVTGQRGFETTRPDGTKYRKWTTTQREHKFAKKADGVYLVDVFGNLDSGSYEQDSTPDPPPPPPPASMLQALVAPGPFAQRAPAWGDAAAWQPDSQTFINKLVQNVSTMPLCVGSYGVSISYAKASDPVRSVTSQYGPSGSFHCPDTATPANGSDGHLVVAQPDGSIHEMWQAKRQADKNWRAGNYGHLPAGAHGYPGEIGCRGSSFALAAGCLTPDDVKTGVTHKLIGFFPTPCVRAAYVQPSNSSDGIQTGADTLPEGALLVLDPNASLAGLTPLERAIGQGWKDYGIYVADKDGSPEIAQIAVDPKTWTTVGEPNPWAPLGLTSEYEYPNGLIGLIPKLRVAKFVGLTAG